MDLKEAQLSGYQIHTRHPWELARKKVVADLVKRFVPVIRNERSVVLDMGCGDVWLVEQLSKDWPLASFQAVDIAFTAEMIQQYNERFSETQQPIRAFGKMEESIRALDEGQSIDLVLLLDVIEHIEDDIAFLTYLQKHPGITAQTRILITVPAFQGLFSAHDVFLEHYRRYTNSQLAKHIQQAGMIPLEQGYFFSSLIFPRAIQKVVEFVKPRTATGVGDWKGTDSQSKLFEQILWTDYTISKQFAKTGIKLPGLSNYSLCKVSAS